MADIPTSSPYHMLPIAEALSIITDSLTPLPPITLPLSSALHCTLAQDVVSAHPIPAFRASVKDGYALCFPTSSSPPPSQWPILPDAQYAGSSPSDTPMTPGSAAYVTTGAPLPPGATAVIMVEHCTRSGDTLHITSDHMPPPGMDIREVGCDMQLGELIVSKGAVICAAEIGLLASAGIRNVQVRPRPVIGVLSSGNELTDAATATQSDSDGMMAKGKVIDSNRPMLLAAIRESLPFCDSKDLGTVVDEKEPLHEALIDALNSCDIVVSSGGVSMGRKDLVKPALEQLAHVRFGRVRMKPGKPLTFATKGDSTCAVALPGNPVSCFVCFHVAVAAAARQLAGRPQEGQVVQAVLEQEIQLDKLRPEYHRAVLKWDRSLSKYVATSTGKQDSSRLLSARSANALLVLPASDAVLSKGDVVDALLLHTAQVLPTE